jgi:hypothetical protein
MPLITTTSFRSLKLYFILSFTLLAVTSYGQSINANWKQDLSVSLEEFLKCTETMTDGNRCINFIGESVQKVYKINDFYSQKSARYMTVSEIASFIKDSDKWSSLGHSYEQTALSAAQEYANAKKAVIAVYLNASGVGHVAVITPGELRASGSWGLQVPSAVSFLTTDPEKSFVDKGLSFAFAKNMLKDVVIYGRKY